MSGLLAGMLDAVITAAVGAEGLPEELPSQPMDLFCAWFDEARDSKKYDDPNAMALATATSDGVPSARIVLCKSVDRGAGAISFFTNYTSRKGDELTGNPRAAVVFHWPHANRQARLEGTVERISPEESDAYFQSRALLSRLGAWASEQSRPLESRGELVRRVIGTMAKFGVKGLQDGQASIPRPPHWGGFRITLTSVELWVSISGRLHDRAVWKRASGADAWSATRLCP